MNIIADNLQAHTLATQWALAHPQWDSLTWCLCMRIQHYVFSIPLNTEWINFQTCSVGFGKLAPEFNSSNVYRTFSNVGSSYVVMENNIYFTLIVFFIKMFMFLLIICEKKYFPSIYVQTPNYPLATTQTNRTYSFLSSRPQTCSSRCVFAFKCKWSTFTIAAKRCNNEHHGACYYINKMRHFRPS